MCNRNKVTLLGVSDRLHKHSTADLVKRNNVAGIWCNARVQGVGENMIEHLSNGVLDDDKSAAEVVPRQQDQNCS